MRAFLLGLTVLCCAVAPGAAEEPPAARSPVGAGAYVRFTVLEVHRPSKWVSFAELLRVASPAPGSAVVALEAKDAARIRAAVSRADVSLRHATGAWVLEGRPAILYDVRPESFVADYDVEIVGGSRIMGPIVETLRDGVSLSATLGARTLGLAGAMAAVRRPIPEDEVEFGPDRTSVTIQLPEMQTTAIDEAVAAGDRAAFLIGTPVDWRDADGARPTTRVVLLEVDRMDFEPLGITGSR